MSESDWNWKLFGTPKGKDNNFDPQILANLLADQKYHQKAKDYMSKYFLKLKQSICFWMPSAGATGMFEIKTREEFRALLDGISLEIKQVTQTAKGMKTTTTTEYKPIATVFLKTNLHCAYLRGDPTAPLVHKEGSSLFINNTEPYLHANKEPKPFKSFPRKTQEVVDYVWEKVCKEILCSNDVPNYEYLKKFFIYSIMGEKIDSRFVFLFGEQGAGKSTMFTLISKYVLGKPGIKSTPNAELLMEGKFNSALEGKRIIALEELGKAGTVKVSADELERDIKFFTSSDAIEIHRKFAEPYQIPNNMNLFVLTNNFGALRRPGRRMFATEVSSKYCHLSNWANKFWDDFHERIDACEDFGYAFYRYCCEEFERIKKEDPKWCFRDPPENELHRRFTEMNKAPILQFIEETYIKTKKGMSVRCTTAHEKFFKYRANKGSAKDMKPFFEKYAYGGEYKKEYIPGLTFIRMVRKDIEEEEKDEETGISEIVKRSARIYECSYKELVKIFLEKGYMTQGTLDDYEDGNNTLPTCQDEADLQEAEEEREQDLITNQRIDEINELKKRVCFYEDLIKTQKLFWCEDDDTIKIILKLGQKTFFDEANFTEADYEDLLWNTIMLEERDPESFEEVEKSAYGIANYLKEYWKEKRSSNNNGEEKSDTVEESGSESKDEQTEGESVTTEEDNEEETDYDSSSEVGDFENLY